MSTGRPEGPVLALKVDVDTLRGTLLGVPALLELLGRLGLRASFLFSVGPDHTGRALRRVFRRGFLSKVRRTSVIRHYGLPTLLYGVLLPGPHIGRRAGHVMRRARAAGHEVGLHSYDHVRWQDGVASHDAAWAARELDRGLTAFRRAVGEDPATIGAAGWQINGGVPALEARMGFRYASDVRGFRPFRPVMEGRVSDCVQLPTTLPTVDELLGWEGMKEADVVTHLLGLTATPTDHVFTLHAELEGMALEGLFHRLLKGWRRQGYRLTSLGGLYGSLPGGGLPRHAIDFAEVPGRAGRLACQAAEPYTGKAGAPA